MWKARVLAKSPRFYQTCFFYGHPAFFSNTTRYYGAGPYPSPSPSGPLRWEIAADGGDFVGDLVQLGRWYSCAFVGWRDGSGTHHRFYYDLPNTAKLIVDDQDGGYFSSVDSNAEICFGDAPWDHVRSGPNSKEQLRGRLRGLKIFTARLSEVDLLDEASSDALASSLGRSAIWYHNSNPRPDDLLDKSGRGNHFSWYNSSTRASLYVQP